MTRLLERLAYLNEFRSILAQPEVYTLNIYGEKGVGKTALGEQLRADAESGGTARCGCLDCAQFSGMTGSLMVEVLYELCGVFAAMDIPAPARFHIADGIDSKRHKRASYLEQQALPGLDLALEVEDFVSSFIEIPYVSAGLKTVKLMADLYRRYRPKTGWEKEFYARYSALEENELFRKLPNILAEDVTEPLLNPRPEKRGVILLENCDSLMAKDDSLWDWLCGLIEDTPDVLWVLFSRKKQDGLCQRYLPVRPMDWEEASRYLAQELEIADEETRQRVFRLSNGSPFYMQRIAAQLEGEMSEEAWAKLESQKNDSGHFARETLRGLSESRQEILMQLSFALYFDEELFKRLFPGRLFGLYLEWFDSSLFTCDGAGHYSVQHSMRDELQAYLATLEPSLSRTCLENLFSAEEYWLQQNASRCPVGESKRHLESLCSYGSRLDDPERYFSSLLGLKGSVLLIGGLPAYCGLLEQLAPRLPSVRSRLRAWQELAATSFCCGRYEGAWRATDAGLAEAREARADSVRLQLLCVQMNLAHIDSRAPAGGGGAVRGEIDLALEYRELARTLELNYATQTRCVVTADLFLARAYIARREWPEALACLEEIFSLCRGQGRLNALALHGGYAEALELRGVLYSEGGEKDKALECYLKSVEAYQLGELYLDQWDGEFYLNYGLAYKRTAERYFSQGETKLALEMLELAIMQYQAVQARMPDMVDTFCKMGFACTDGAAHIWADPAWDGQTERLLSWAEEAVAGGVRAIQNATGVQGPGNRQICNIRCSASRLSGLFYARRGETERAEGYFLKSIRDGETAIEVASEHAYSYMGFAQSCLEYARFTGNADTRRKYAKIGAEAVHTARTYMGDPNSFADLLAGLEGCLG